MVYYAPKAPGWPGAEDYSWRNAAAHLGMGADPLVRRPERLLAYVPDLAELLTLPQDREAVDLIRRHERTGRPLGDEVSLERLERRLHRWLAPGKAGGCNPPICGKYMAFISRIHVYRVPEGRLELAHRFNGGETRRPLPVQSRR